MMSDQRSNLHSDVQMQTRFAEFEEIVRAITRGEVDAFVVSSGDSDEVLTLGNVDRPYRLLLEHMRQGGATLGADGRILYANSQFGVMVGAPLEAIIGSPLESFIRGEEAEQSCSRLRNASGEREEVEVCFTRADRTTFPASASAIFDHKSNSTFLTVTDLTEKKQQQALIAEEALSRSILDQAVDAIVVCDSSGKILRASHTARVLCRCDPIAKPFASVFPLRYLSRSFDFGALFSGKTLRNIECVMSLPEGATTTLLLNAGAVRGGVGQILGITLALTDITSRKRAEEALRQAHDELATKVVERTVELTNLSRHLLDVAEEERSKIAAELHDEMGATLTTLGMNLGRLAQMPSLPASVRPQVLDTIEQLRQVAFCQRRIVDSLRPVLLDAFGLDEAIRQYLESWRKHSGLNVEADIPEVAVPLGKAEALAIFRTLQESLTNVAKHARASSVRVSLAINDDGVRLSIKDDGVGIPALNEKLASHGIVGMRERLLRFGGGLTIGADESGRGTQVEAFIPSSARD